MTSYKEDEGKLNPVEMSFNSKLCSLQCRLKEVMASYAYSLTDFLLANLWRDNTCLQKNYTSSKLFVTEKGIKFGWHFHGHIK